VGSGRPHSEPLSLLQKEKKTGRASFLKKENKFRKNGVRAVHALADEAVEMAAAVWAIRNRPEPTSG
jgi:hypothetical protein